MLQLPQEDIRRLGKSKKPCSVGRKVYLKVAIYNGMIDPAESKGHAAMTVHSGAAGAACRDRRPRAGGPANGAASTPSPAAAAGRGGAYAAPNAGRQRTRAARPDGAASERPAGRTATGGGAGRGGKGLLEPTATGRAPARPPWRGGGWA